MIITQYRRWSFGDELIWVDEQSINKEHSYQDAPRAWLLVSGAIARFRPITGYLESGEWREFGNNFSEGSLAKTLAELSFENQPLTDALIGERMRRELANAMRQRRNYTRKVKL